LKNVIISPVKCLIQLKFAFYRPMAVTGQSHTHTLTQKNR